MGSVHSGSEASLIPNKAGVGAADEMKNADDQSLASGASNSTQHTHPSAGSGAKLVMSTRMRKELEAKLEKEREEAERRRVKHGRDEDGQSVLLKDILNILRPKKLHKQGGQFRKKRSCSKTHKDNSPKIFFETHLSFLK